AIYLVAQVRETRAHRALCAIAADGERVSDLIEDGLTEDFGIILARTYDGDPAALRSVIEAAGADEFSRDAAFVALAWLTATGQIDRDDTAGYLRHLHTTLQPKGPCWIWVAWQRAIADLGLKELVPQVEDVFERGSIEPMSLSFEDFQDDLTKAINAPDPAAAFSPSDRDDGRLDDLVTHMSGWAAFQPAEPEPPLRGIDLPVRNPYRNVGRNDPCPCGSGSKFKKCCLDRLQANAKVPA
ncbi:MAG TPA: DUF1186 domain-containing protein, partial [Rhodopila sp.]